MVVPEGGCGPQGTARHSKLIKLLALLPKKLNKLVQGASACSPNAPNLIGRHC
jgi:hypothetical protein